jgi:hypothetical protein
MPHLSRALLLAIFPGLVLAAGSGVVQARQPSPVMHLGPMRTLQTAALAEGPTALVDGRGRATVAWLARPQSDPRIANVGAFAAVEPRHASVPVLIGGRSPKVWVDDGSPLTVDQDRAGDTTAVWTQSHYRPATQDFIGPTVMMSAERPAGGEWSVPTAVSSRRLALDGFSPQLAVNSAGAAILVWSRSIGTRDEPSVVSAYRAAGSRSWSRPEVVPKAVGDEPRVEIDDAGNALMVFDVGQEDSVYAIRRLVGHGWQAPHQLGGSHTKGGRFAYAPRFTLSAGGTALATWLNAISDTDDTTYVSRMSAAGRWTQPTHWPQCCLPVEDAMAIGPKGRATVAWETPSKIMVMRSRRDGSWRNPVRLADAGHFRAGPEVVVDRHGNVLVAWNTSRDGTGPRLEARYRVARGTWTPRRRLSPDGARPSLPPPNLFSIAVGGTHAAAVAWVTPHETVEFRRLTVR